MDMSELIDPFARLIEDVCTPAAIREIEQGGDSSAMWNAFVESGFLDALVAEESGGAGLSLEDAAPLIALLGRHAVPLPVGDGPAILAMRPESIGLAAGNQGKIHRVTDYGTHGLVDIDLPDGTRIKSMIGNARAFEAGQSVDIKPSAIAAYRDNAVIHRT